MELNNEIVEILKTHKIDKDQGLLCLLGIFHELEIETSIPHEVVRAVTLTKIVEKDYTNKTIKWNIPLYSGQQTAFDWVGDWIEPFGKINPERKGTKRDCISRMKKFFSENPEYRKEDVFKARDMYLSTIKDPQFLKLSHKFIYEGSGAFKSSMLLQWCEKLKEKSPINPITTGLIK